MDHRRVLNNFYGVLNQETKTTREQKMFRQFGEKLSIRN